MESITVANKISLKPEIKSPFFPSKSRQNVYEKELDMTLSIQIGDIVGWLKLSYDTDYNDPERKLRVQHEIRGFDQISQIINIDVDDIVARYISSIPVFYEERKVQIRKYNITIWETSWVHKFIDVITELNLPGLTYSIPSKESFAIDEFNGSVHITISYKGNTMSPSIDVERGVTKYILRGGYAYGVSRDGKYLTPENLLKAFVKRVDEYCVKKSVAQVKEEKRQETIKNTIKKFCDLFGDCAHEGKTERYQYGPRKYEEYKIDSYYIPIKDKIVDGRVSKRQIKITSDNNGLFTLGSFNYLSEDDVNQILCILNKD